MATRRVKIFATCAVAGLLLVAWESHPSTPSITASSISYLSTWSYGSNVDEDIYHPLTEDSGPFIESEYVKGVAGFTYFENLYLYNGTFYFVTTDPSQLPEQGGSYVMTGQYDRPEDHDNTNVPPGPDRWQVIDPTEARLVFGDVAIRQPGSSMFFNDVYGQAVSSFLDHYYHCEMFLGGWRLLVSAGETDLPARLMYRSAPAGWRDHARITPWFQRTVLATTVIEELTDWDDRKESRMTYLYDKIAIIDRWAAHRFGKEVYLWNKAIADIPSLAVPDGWLDPLRDRIVELAESAGCHVGREKPTVPVVTYIDRQLTTRRLVDDDNKLLLESLWELDREGLIEFHDAQMEVIPRLEQFCLAARTDIMLGVHGNGLSHQLWMKPGAGVMEIMDIGGFARDYAILAELMGHEYYAIHNDTYLAHEQWTRPDGWSIGQTPGFHTPYIRAYGPYIASLVKDMAQRRTNGLKAIKW